MIHRDYLDIHELEKRLADGTAKVPIGSMWRHFKGGDFRVLRIVFDSESLQLEVVHESVENPKVAFTRSLTNWLDAVDFKGYTLSRFEMIENKHTEQ